MFKNTPFFLFSSLLVVAGFLSACSTSIKPEQLKTVADFRNAPNKGLLVMDLSGDVFCNQARLTFANQDQTRITLPLTVKKNGAPAIKAVDPGKYKLISGYCSNLGTLTGSLPDLPIWFGGISVDAGQAVYAGTIIMGKDEMKTRREGADAVVGFLNLDTNKEVNFATYHLENRIGETIEKLGPEFSDLSAELVYNPPLVILDKSEFRDAIQRAYAPTAEGKNPSQDEVNAKLDMEIATALKNSLESIVKRNPDYKGEFPISPS